MIDLDELKRRKRTGHRYVQVTINRSRSPLRWDSVRVMPGVPGRVVGPLADLKGTYLVDVLIDDLIRALEKRSKE